MSEQFRHECHAEPPDFRVGFALWVKVRASLAASHAETGQGIFESLLKAEELEDRQIDRRMKTETTFVGTESRVVLLREVYQDVFYNRARRCYLHSEPSVDLRLALVILPDNAELQDTLRDLNDLESLFICGVGCQEGPQALLELVAGLERPMNNLARVGSEETYLFEFGFKWEDHYGCFG